MPKARKKKNSSFQTTITNSVFLYGRPNKEKLVTLQQMQNSYTDLINRDIDPVSYTHLTLPTILSV